MHIKKLCIGRGWRGLGPDCLRNGGLRAHTRACSLGLRPENDRHRDPARTAARSAGQGFAEGNLGRGGRFTRAFGCGCRMGGLARVRGRLVATITTDPVLLDILGVLVH